MTQSAHLSRSSHEPAEPLVLDPVAADPDAENAELRSRGPATRVDLLGVPAWSVSDPAVLKDLLTSPQVSKDPRRHWPSFAEHVESWPLVLWVAVENMFTAYGSDHRRLRRLVAPAFSARRVAAMREAVEQVVQAALDDLERDSKAGEPVDVREHYAYPIPIRVISHLMGVPESQWDALRTVVDGVFSTTLTVEESAANAVALYGILDELIAEKRAHPGDDMTSLLLASRDDEGDGTAMSEENLRDTLLLVISAGYQTTVDLIDQAITALLSHPDQLAQARSGQLSWTDVVEETLRLEPAVKHLPLRYAVSDIALPDGQTIREGEAILASYGAANRHPHWNAKDPHSFDATRPRSGDHLAFGHGVHFCLGAPLARMEAEIALAAFFARYPDAQLPVPAGELARVPSLISNGHQHLPITLTAP